MPMPTYKNMAGKTVYNFPAITSQLSSPAPDVLVMEALHAMPNTLGGAQANFQRGLATGFFTGLASAMGIPLVTVGPREWQRVMIAPTQVDWYNNDGKELTTKEASIRVAQKLFPGASLFPTPDCRKPSDGMADALLIAEWYCCTRGDKS
jgi:hypothetical protein